VCAIYSMVHLSDIKSVEGEYIFMTFRYRMLTMYMYRERIESKVYDFVHYICSLSKERCSALCILCFVSFYFCTSKFNY